MKCIKSMLSGDIRRVTDEEAFDSVRDSKVWQYCPKHQWKSRRNTDK